jgi:HAMP domain-containing protein
MLSISVAALLLTSLLNDYMVAKSIERPSSSAIDANQKRRRGMAARGAWSWLAARLDGLQKISNRLDLSSDGKAIAFPAGTL